MFFFVAAIPSCKYTHTQEKKTPKRKNYEFKYWL